MNMIGKEIAQYSGKVVDKTTLDRIASSENVKVVRDCGIDGSYEEENFCNIYDMPDGGILLRLRQQEFH